MTSLQRVVQLLSCFAVGTAQYLDRWNYYGTEARDDGYTDFGPEDWGDIVCDESTREKLDTCLAYRDKWHTGRAWDIEKNYCRNCPAGTNHGCGRHHMSPINLMRNRGLGYWENDGVAGDGAHPEAKECIDVHWMKYEDSYCSVDQLVEANAFTVERHALRITQPITVFDNDDFRIDCRKEGVGRRFGRIDYSKGFSQWWFLSHIDLHTPSEHTQEGKRYDAEMQLHHFYSVTAEEAKVANEMGTVSIFLQAYDDATPYRYLDKLICLWRRNEYDTRRQCGMAPIAGDYPGCFPLHRRNVRRAQEQDIKKPKFQTVQDWILARQEHAQSGRNVSEFPKLVMDDMNWDEPEMSDEEWADFIQAQSDQMKAEDDLWHQVRQDYNHSTEAAHEEFHSRHRRLIGGDELEWFNYFPMLGVRTEYYYRYSGSQTIPPCYGTFDPESRAGTNHWRVMKDPIRIHPRQLREIRRLIAERIAPRDDPVNPCNHDTAAKVTPDGQVSTARPLQDYHLAHFKVFCECKDWGSKWPEDKEWCRNDPYERFYGQPYNFRSSGF